VATPAAIRHSVLLLHTRFMNHRKLLQIVHIVLFATIIAGCGPAKYNLNGGKDKKGTSVRIEEKTNSSDSNLTCSTRLGSVAGKIDMDTHCITIIRILEMADGKASVIEVVHEKDIATTKTTINGRNQTQEQKKPLHGMTVVCKLIDGKWTQEMKGSTPTKEQKRLLADPPLFESHNLYPDHSVVVGETWTVPPDKFKRLLSADMLTCEGSMTCTFVRVSDLDGQKCAVILAELEARGSLLDTQNNEIKLTMNLQGTIYRSLSAFVDLEMKFKGTMKTEADIQQQGQNVATVITGPYAYTVTNKIIGDRVPSMDVPPIIEEASESSLKRNAQNICGVAAAATAAGYNTSGWTSVDAVISDLRKGVSVENNGQIWGPFKVDELDDEMIARIQSRGYITVRNGTATYNPRPANR